MSRPFDGRLEGTPLERWSEDGRRDRLPLLTLPSGVDRVLAVVAHADDETLGCGGTLALARRRGLPVDVVIVTDGAASHGERDSGLVATRRAEAEAALAQLGDGIGLAFLDVPDSATPGHRERIGREVRERAAGTTGSVLLLSTWAGDGHRDHRVVGEVCAEAAGDLGHPLLAAPIWLWHWAEPEDAEVPWETLVRVGLDDELRERTRRARACYRSQTDRGPEGADPVLHPLFLRTFAGDDRLVRIR
ncbi:PIG-L deacetylase family protein [Rathayibacter tanaceti]|uniref:1D-myo-inositol 2-acetamido-2-deoxy-alpha-D-glucopyranoside deacetylase n=2 Tax=Rathayibacter tanaceti TaxID=1671680 RepID=A0A166IK73_9MICO|nr:PIG-L family deacetylase [Rathayibacter tanaceti]KZX22514.1 1D-myo-inositol 2-acetamido-2-deoxy-alpha-D-glucopyranoside deacetylase [Rathayibacter tanaceti]QHC54806.1 PIG-L family deacetylase [Rathayibacter tanaceti]TCO37371.1 LmbE family N-acetylglucosaminyl deacetylase [Rathayibacter tanaceti]